MALQMAGMMDDGLVVQWDALMVGMKVEHSESLTADDLADKLDYHSVSLWVTWMVGSLVLDSDHQLVDGRVAVKDEMWENLTVELMVR